MKIRGFLNRLRSLSGRAKQRLRKWLRVNEGENCPITEVAQTKYKKYTPGYYRLAAKDIELDSKVADDIVAASDCYNDTDGLTRTQKRYHKLMTEALKD